jgi:hypothetical protein
MLSFVDAELSEEEELPSSAVVKGIAGGRGGGPLFCFIVGRARSRSDILSNILTQTVCFVFRRVSGFGSESCGLKCVVDQR